MKSLTNYQLERFTTVEFLPFGLDWTCVAEIQFSENKDLPNDNDPPRRQKVRNSTVEGGPVMTKHQQQPWSSRNWRWPCSGCSTSFPSASRSCSTNTPASAQTGGVQTAPASVICPRPGITLRPWCGCSPLPPFDGAASWPSIAGLS